MLFNRTVKPAAYDSWYRLFDRVDHRILKMAIDDVTKRVDKSFPVPAHLRRSISTMYENFPNLAYPGETHCTCERCDGTGFYTEPHPHIQENKIARRCDCHPRGHSEYRGPMVDGVDEEGIAIKIDPRTGRNLYIKKDCPEGRVLLALLAEWKLEKPAPRRSRKRHEISDEELAKIRDEQKEKLAKRGIK